MKQSHKSFIVKKWQSTANISIAVNLTVQSAVNVQQTANVYEQNAQV